MEAVGVELQKINKYGQNIEKKNMIKSSLKFGLIPDTRNPKFGYLEPKIRVHGTITSPIYMLMFLLWYTNANMSEGWSLQVFLFQLQI